MDFNTPYTDCKMCDNGKNNENKNKSDKNDIYNDDDDDQRRQLRHGVSHFIYISMYHT